MVVCGRRGLLCLLCINVCCYPASHALISVSPITFRESIITAETSITILRIQPLRVVGENLMQPLYNIYCTTSLGSRCITRPVYISIIVCHRPFLLVAKSSFPPKHSHVIYETPSHNNPSRPLSRPTLTTHPSAQPCTRNTTGNTAPSSTVGTSTGTVVHSRLSLSLSYGFYPASVSRLLPGLFSACCADPLDVFRFSGPRVREGKEGREAGGCAGCGGRSWESVA